MKKSEAINKLNILKEKAKPLLNMFRNSQDFIKWHRYAQVTIEYIFGRTTRHLKDFASVRYSLSACSLSTPEYEFQNAYRDGVDTAITIIDSFITEVEEFWPEEGSGDQPVTLEATERVKLIINRFHQVSRQLLIRRSGKPIVEIEDEYDVQYLFHALLKIYFNDIRPEEYTPSYAGAASRVDFLLKQENLIIELKKTRKGLGAKEIGDQLIIDSQRYQAHPNCGQLICFVYDPEGWVPNARGLEEDLTKDLNGVPVSVFIRPLE